MRGTIYSLLIVAFCLSCKTNKVSSYQKIARKKYDSPITYLINSSKTHVVCSAEDERTLVKYFFIYDINQHEILYEKKLTQNGTFKWLSNEELEIVPFSGRPSLENEKKSYIYNVKQKEVINRTNNLSNE